jgi:hypothetical protein
MFPGYILTSNLNRKKIKRLHVLKFVFKFGSFQKICVMFHIRVQEPHNNNNNSNKNNNAELRSI